MVQNDLQDVIENLLVLERHDKKNLIVRKWRIKWLSFFVINWQVNFLVLKQLLLCDIVESVQDVW